MILPVKVIKPEGSYRERPTLDTRLIILVTIDQEGDRMSATEAGLSLFDAARAMSVPFTEERLPQDREVQANGLLFHYLDWGGEGKQTILFLHGALQQGHSWDFVSLSLCADYHVLALDARGHGDSQWAPDGDYSLDAHQQDLDGVVEALGLDPFVLVGHSMGGRNAYVFASRHPRALKALTVVDTGPEMGRLGESRIRGFRELPDELDSYEEFADRVQAYTGRTREQVLGALKYSIRERPDGKWSWKYDKALRAPGFRPDTWDKDRLWDCIRSISRPTLLVRGGRSDFFTPEVMDRMLQLIPGSTASVVPDAGHLVAGDNPAGFLVALRTLLDRV